jgi:hypothetical protein
MEVSVLFVWSLRGISNTIHLSASGLLAIWCLMMHTSTTKKESVKTVLYWRRRAAGLQAIETIQTIPTKADECRHGTMP